MALRFASTLAGVEATHLAGFFVDWPDPPSPETHLHLLQGSYAVELAIDEDSGQVIGFANAISDGVLSAYIPLLEVLPEHQGRGIGRQLMERLLERLRHLYMVDLVCDPEKTAFYERFAMQPWTAMIKRNGQRQNGATS